MRPVWRYSATFVAGLVVGAVTAASYVGWHWNRNFQDSYALQLADQANVAKEILSGGGPALAERIKVRLPEYVSALRGPLGVGDRANWALWVVSDVYKAAGTAPPTDLQAVFASLPPRPSCKRPSSARGIDGANR